MFSKVVVSIAAFSVFFGVFAQSPSPLPTSPAQVDSCILTCTQQGLANSTCAGVLDIQCLCTSPSFQFTTTQCLMANCTAQELQTADGLSAAECANFTSSSSTTTTSPTAPAGSNTNSPAAKTNAAHQLTFGVGHIVGLTTALSGVLAGFAILL